MRTGSDHACGSCEGDAIASPYLALPDRLEKAALADGIQPADLDAGAES